jgi:apolipoprotein N-acyltransferase
MSIETISSMPHIVSPAAAKPPYAILSRLWPWLAAAASGMLLALCFPPYHQGWLVWIALTPLICALWFPENRKRSHIRAALLGYVTGLVFFTLVFIWLSKLATLFKTPALLGLPPLLSLLLGLDIAAWGWFIARLPKPPSPSTTHHSPSTFLSSRGNLAIGALAACAWVTQEWIRGWLFSGFGWDGLGVALHSNITMIQAADFLGVLGLSWLIAFCNVMTVVIVRRILQEIGPQFMKRIRWEFSITVTLVMLVFAYGVHALLHPVKLDHTDLKVAMIQPNVPQNEKWDAASEDRLFERLDILTLGASISKPDLIIWPEAATPRGMDADEHNYQFVLHETRHGKYALLIGTTLNDLDSGGEYNAAALLTEGGKKVQTYHKIHLVPYGEYLPMRPLLEPIAGDLVPGDFLAGSNCTVLTLDSPPLRLAPLICFEDTLGDLTRHFVNNGADVLVNLTNDGWFQQSAAVEQQLVNALFRAVENRRPLLRCTNTGITASVDPDGRVNRWAEPFRESVPFAQTIPVPKNPPLTFYTRYGDWVAHLSCAIVCGSLLWSLARRFAGPRES